MTLDDKEIIQSCQKGDQEAFQQLLERYQAANYAIAYNVIHDYELARDISQEAWVRVYFNIDKFDLTRRFYPWLCRITTNLCLDYLKHNKLKTKPLTEVNIDEAVAQTSDTDAEVSEEKEKVRRLLEKLPVKYRTLLVLKDVEGLPSQEIAYIVKCNEATVRWRIHKARKLFKSIWGKI